MARQKTSFARFLAEGERLVSSLANNSTEAPHLEAPRQKLVVILDDVRTLGVQQDLHTANKQQVSQRLKTRLSEGKKLLTFLRTGIKEHFGNHNDKVVEFGVQPFRRRKRDTSLLEANRPAEKTPQPTTPAATPAVDPKTPA
jgi:hypothetical protein